MAEKVLRDGGRVWIDSVPSFSELRMPVCTFAGSMAAASAVTEHPLTSEDVLALSGYAFHVRWCVPDVGPTGCPGSVSAEQGRIPEAFNKHSGWQLKMIYAEGPNGWDKPNMQQAIPEIIASIDAGKPVIIEDKYINASVLYGYINQGERFLVNTYIEGPTEVEAADLSRFPHALAFLLKGYVKPPPFPEVFRDILNNAATWWHEKHEPNTCGGPDMRGGKAALEAWGRFYASIDELAPKYRGGKERLLYNSLFNYQTLYENRRAAANFLSKHAGRFSQAKEAIRRAARLYEKEAEVLGSALDPEDDFWRPMSVLRNIFLSYARETREWQAARSIDRTDSWTAEVQERERQIMKEALKLEESAISQLEEALSQITA